MRAWVVVSSALVACGLLIFLYKVAVLQYPLSGGEQRDIWRVEVAVDVKGKGEWANVEIPLPSSTRYQQLLSEEVRSGPLDFSITEEGGNRYGRWNGRLTGSTIVSYQAAVATRMHAQPLPVDERRTEYPSEVAAFLEASPGIDTSDRVVQALSKELLLDPRDKVKLAREIYRFVGREIGASLRSGSMAASSVVEEGRGNALGRARLFCALARTNGLPCRVIMGLSVGEATPEELSYWNEVYIGAAWIPFDVVVRRAEVLPPDRLVLSTRDAKLVSASGADAVSDRFFVQSESKAYENLLRRRLSESDHAIDRFSILFLPVQVQQNLRLLLLIPLGALVITLLRTAVGLKTFGMFMPMLIALAFTATGLLKGSAVFGLIIAFALLSRQLIQSFYLLLVARVAFILTFVILLMAVFIVAGDQVGVEIGAVTAFPFVIMTMIVERISVSLEEEGLANTFRRIGGTMVEIYVTYGVIHEQALQTLFLVFPELLLSILGLLMATGRYTGYRLSELMRFRALAVGRPAPTVLLPADRQGGGR
jgi:hypothetical protein